MKIRIECELPFMLALSDGEYTDKHSKPIDWHEMPSVDGPGRTRVSCRFDSTETSEIEIEAESTRQANSLIRPVNRLIRWYRVISSDRSILDVPMWKASPFRFYNDATHEAWGQPLAITAPSRVQPAFFTYAAKFPELSDRIKSNFATGSEPPVADLFLIDARQSLDEGRFREAVLFSWSTIDATFSSRFDALVDQRLSDEWGGARSFLKGIDFGLRHRMTIGMRLVGGQSFFKETGDLGRDCPPVMIAETPLSIVATLPAKRMHRTRSWSPRKWSRS